MLCDTVLLTGWGARGIGTGPSDLSYTRSCLWQGQGDECRPEMRVDVCCCVP